jgi:hypothetical protein
VIPIFVDEVVTLFNGADSGFEGTSLELYVKTLDKVPYPITFDALTQ